MTGKIRQHLVAYAEKNNWSTDDETLIEVLTEATKVYSKKISDSRWWYTEFVVVGIDGMLIGYEYARANRDENVRELGWDFDPGTICEVEAVQETITVYRKVKPTAKGAVINTMTDPNNKPADQEDVKEQATEGSEATQDKEEGGTEG